MPGAGSLVARLRSLGKRVFFVTNNSTRTREEFVAKFNKLGFQANLVSLSTDRRVQANLMCGYKL